MKKWFQLSRFKQNLASWALNPYLWLSLREKKFRKDLIESLSKLKSALAQEGQETREMLEIYVKYSQGLASKEEMERANAQFRDLIKALGLGVFAFLPFAPVSIPLIVKIGRKLGIEILPSSFRSQELPPKIDQK